MKCRLVEKVPQSWLGGSAYSVRVRDYFCFDFKHILQWLLLVQNPDHHVFSARAPRRTKLLLRLVRSLYPADCSMSLQVTILDSHLVRVRD